MSDQLDTAAVESLVAGRNADPFGLLGPHRPQAQAPWQVRVFDPGAKALTLLIDGRPESALPLVKVHEAGLFNAILPPNQTPGAYRLLGQSYAGERYEMEDAYRFWPQISDLDIYLLAEGTHERLYEVLGCHPAKVDGIPGARFALWAPNAELVSLVGDFNAWDTRRHPMRLRREAGVWELFIPGAIAGQSYKYAIRGQGEAEPQLRADPFGFGAETPPRTASRIVRLPKWVEASAEEIAARQVRQTRNRPVSIYEVHLGSWARNGPQDLLSYRELAERLVPYARDLGFTHLEFMPISEFPYDGSWGYQPIGLFAPTSRHGSAQDFAELVEAVHAAGMNVILDWVPGHFPRDAHGLGRFDGTALYEHQDPKEGAHQDWGTLIYNYGRREVRNYLVSNALYWIDRFAVDALRVDAVASMIYRDYSREDGQWVPNQYGGRENLEAISFLQEVNARLYGKFPHITTFAEESTAWPGVSQPTDQGGLGFGYKWNMGWMNDTLRYMAREPVHRSHHHNELTFSLLYAFSENYVLPLSHDEVVHGKGSLLARMPGDPWQQFANLRLLYGYLWTHPGKKLLFMGQEFAQGGEWNHRHSLDWHLLGSDWHQGVQTLVRDLNQLYTQTPALYARDCEPGGFQWLDADDAAHSLMSFLRWGEGAREVVAVVCNFTPVPRSIRLGLPFSGLWREALNSDHGRYGGSHLVNATPMEAQDDPWQGQPASVSLTVPPLATLVLSPA